MRCGLQILPSCGCGLQELRSCGLAVADFENYEVAVLRLRIQESQKVVADLRLGTKLLNVQLRTCGCGLKKLKFGCRFADCGLKKKLAVPSTVLNLKRPQLNRMVQVLTGHCYLQQHKKTTGRAESSLCPKCSLDDKTPNHQIGTCKLYQDIRVKYFGITKTTVHDVVTKCNINKLATYLKEVGRLS